MGKSLPFKIAICLTRVKFFSDKKNTQQRCVFLTEAVFPKKE
ncbi:hypothetical protein GTPT_1258 [Tatumella ptyseos ATCC 33301]|uniref:Uncharacterized protein n=1 Tax=Tatumella ptyseos ATCC 33301 TaxID=1005995 RepID=A0A085JJS9_9GAMM|nr:hypothetical protein GTPT_1258 [Tatumella ptyseos ATCC 33301]